MTQEEAIDKLTVVAAKESDDPESAHGKADDILLEYLKTSGQENVEKAWNNVSHSCGGFWYS